jgi:hypothetical protein
MKVIIVFDVENAAFEDNFAGEVGWILSQAVQKIIRQRERAPGCICTTPESDDVLIDCNGNRVGTVELEESC